MAFWNKKTEETNVDEFVVVSITAPVKYIDQVQDLAFDNGFRHERVLDDVEGRGELVVELPASGIEKVLGLASGKLGGIFLGKS